MKIQERIDSIFNLMEEVEGLVVDRSEMPDEDIPALKEIDEAVTKLVAALEAAD